MSLLPQLFVLRRLNRKSSRFCSNTNRCELWVASNGLEDHGLQIFCLISLYQECAGNRERFAKFRTPLHLCDFAIWNQVHYYCRTEKQHENADKSNGKSNFRCKPTHGNRNRSFSIRINFPRDLACRNSAMPDQI